MLSAYPDVPTARTQGRGKPSVSECVPVSVRVKRGGVSGNVNAPRGAKGTGSGGRCGGAEKTTTAEDADGISSAEAGWASERASEPPAPSTAAELSGVQRARDGERESESERERGGERVRERERERETERE